jgi:hypothetical protein
VHKAGRQPRRNIFPDGVKAQRGRIDKVSGCCKCQPPALSMLHDAAVIVPALIPCSPTRSVSPFSTASFSSTSAAYASNVTNFLKDAGIDEIETLNQHQHGPTAGQCQFSSVAMALCGDRSSGFDMDFRPDLELRQLAIHTIASNPHMYEDYLLASSQGRTTRAASRSANSTGGRGVNLGQYLNNMSKSRCDGDAVTLQALCDALKITVRIVKPVDATSFQEDWQTGRVEAAMNTSQGENSWCSTSQCNITACDDFSAMPTPSQDERGLIDVCETNTCTPSSSRSCSPSLSTSSSEDDINMGVDELNESRSERFLFDQDSAEGRQRLYISQEIQPRRLDKADPRLSEVQRSTKGRLVWLSHIGDEAHFRFLRAIDPSHAEEEACEVSKGVRVARIEDLCVPRDGFLVTRFSLGTKNNGRDPRCSLCLERFSRLNGSPIVSPSCCHHHCHQDCLAVWKKSTSSSCAVCSCAFSFAIDAVTGEDIVLPVDEASLPRYATNLDFGCVDDFLRDLKERMSDHPESFEISRLADTLQKVKASLLRFDDKNKGIALEEAVLEFFEALRVLTFAATRTSVSDLFDAGILLALRTVLGRLEGVEGIFYQALKSMLDFFATLKTRDLIVVNVEHFENSGGLPFFLLHHIGLVDALRDFFSFFGSSSVPLREAVLVDLPPVKIARKAATGVEEVEAESKKAQPKKRSLPEKKKTSSAPTPLKKQKKVVQVPKPARKKKTTKAPPALPPPRLVLPVIQRAPGKRQVKPVDTTNISHEHLALRCYKGAV